MPSEALIADGKRIAVFAIDHKPPPSLNAQERMHWAKRRKLREVWGYMAVAAWFEAGRPRFRSPIVTIDLYFPDRRRRDRDNYTGAIKPILDALKGRAWDGDDDSESINLRPVGIMYDPVWPRVQLELVEREVQAG